MPGNHVLTSAMAAHDLAGRRELATTVAMLGSILVVTAACLASYALVLGNWRVERSRIDRDAWSLVLRVGNSLSTRGLVTSELIAQIKARLAAEIDGDGEVIRAVHPYRTCRDRIELFFQENFVVDLVGRTVYFDETGQRDLYLHERALQPGGKELLTAKDKGILLAPRALKKLGLGTTPELPFSLNVEVLAKKQSIDVIGVFNEDLPDRYDFVITEGYESILTQGETSSTYVLSSQLPDAWLAGPGSLNLEEDLIQDQLPAEISNHLEAVELHDNQLRLQARSYFDPNSNAVQSELSLSQWRDLLVAIESEMRKRTGVGCDGFEQPLINALPQFESEQAYDFVNVYVREASALAPAADICDQLIPGIDGEGTVNRDVIARLGSIDSRLQESMRTVSVQQVVIIAMAAFTLTVLQIFRAFGKTREIGMLRAIGMKRRQVLSFVVIQSALLSGLGTLIGLLMGVCTAILISWYSYDSLDESLLGVHLPYQLLVSIVLGALVITLLSGFLAAWPWIFREPAKLMR